MAETAKTLGNLSSDPDSEISNVEYLTLPGRKKRVLLSSINQRDRSGRSLLYKCAGQGLSEAVKVLCEAGAQVNIKDNAGWSPLHEATVNGHEIVVKYLLEAGANVNCQGKF
jgi:ankyrin repeat protein